MIRYLRRPAGRAKENAIVAFDPGAPVRRHPPAVPVVVVATPVEMVKGERNAKLPCRSLQHTNALRHHFLADTVSRDNGDLVVLCHGISLTAEPALARLAPGDILLRHLTDPQMPPRRNPVARTDQPIW